ncbi:uncharacterized protein LOC143625606 [Bidens hawaiensis]|uniref:uncharacterized protein LOC143625606 n=1 Tax=Bidens hawaiensis TaxID=980011 RepID=UPI00404B86B1
MYEHCFARLQEEIRSRLEEDICPLIGFSGEVLEPLGSLTLPLTLRHGERTRTVCLRFSVVRAPSKYNIILGRPGIKALRAVASTVHGYLRFPTPIGVATIRSSAEIVASIVKSNKAKKIPQGTEEWVLNRDHAEQTVRIGTQLSDRGKAGLKEVLLHNTDVIAWSHEDMIGVPRSLVQHSLDESQWIEPVKQKKRSLGPEKSRSVLEETWKLLQASPKDSYPLTVVEKKIESLSQFPLRCFLDAYKGYHQIHMDPRDEEKTTFYINEGTFYYTKLPFGLKNAGATYQRFMDRLFELHRGRNVEIYVDDLFGPHGRKKGSPDSHILRESHAEGTRREVLTYRKVDVISHLHDQKAETVFFQAHVIRILTDRPLQQVLMKPEVSGRLAKWAIELGGHAIEYKPRTSFKGQILADFITESILGDDDILVDQEKAGDELDRKTRKDSEKPLWLLYTDGNSNGDGSGAGLIFISPEGNELTYAIRLEFPSTNNEAEYEALLAGLRMAQRIKVRHIKAHVDSLLVANQIKSDTSKSVHKILFGAFCKICNLD